MVKRNKGRKFKRSKVAIGSKLVYTKELDFIPKLQLSKARRAVYYTSEDYFNKKLPKRYLSKNFYIIKEPYVFVDKKLYNTETKEFVIKNSKTANKPRYWIMNSQDIYSGKFERQARNALIHKLHDYFKELVKDCPILVKEDNERFRLVLTWYINPDCVTVDYDNLWIYEKCILDVLHKEAIGLCKVKEDSHKYFKGGSKDYEYRDKEGFKIEIFKV